MKPLRMMMLTEYYPPFDRGGAEWSTFHLVSALKNRGHEVTVFTPNYGTFSPEKEVASGVYRFPYYLKLRDPAASVSPFHHTHLLWWIWTTLCLIQQVILRRPTILHVQGKYFLPQAITVGKLFGLSVITTLRDYIALCPHGYCLRREREYLACSAWSLFFTDLPLFLRNFEIRGWRNYLFAIIGTLSGWITSRWLRFFLPKADRVVAISEKLRKIYETNHISITTTIYNSVSPSDSFTKRRLDIYLLYVGRLTEGKGFPLLLQAYARFAESKMPKLKAIGAGYKKVVTFKNVEYLGQKKYGETLEYIARAQLVIVPSVWEEPFGRVALEALMLGTPVVATNRGGLPEIVEHQVTGLIVEPEPDALARGIRSALKNEKRLRKNIHKRSRELQRKFVYGPAEAYEKLYRSLL